MNYLDKTYDKFLKAIYLKLEYLLVRGGFKSFEYNFISSPLNKSTLFSLLTAIY